MEDGLVVKINCQRLSGSSRATPSLHQTISFNIKDIINPTNVKWRKYRDFLAAERAFLTGFSFLPTVNP
jgi:Cdc6-like AAA superfamily ATPase